MCHFSISFVEVHQRRTYHHVGSAYMGVINPLDGKADKYMYTLMSSGLTYRLSRTTLQERR